MNVKNFLIGIAIAVVFIFTFAYGIQAFYPSPDYYNYCKDSMYPKNIPYRNDVNCTYPQEIQQKESQCYQNEGVRIYIYDENGCIKDLTCSDCQKRYNNADKIYSRNLFIITLIAGLVAIFVGALMFKIDAIGSGLMAGGVMSIIYGSIRNWENFSNVIKFILLFLSLVILIWIGMRMNRKK